MSGVDLLRQIVGPLVSVALFNRADGHFSTQGGNFPVGVEEACNHFIAHVQVIPGNLSAQGFTPLGYYRWGIVRRDVAAVTEINVNGLIETVCGIRNFPHAINNLVARTFRDITGHGFCHGRCLTIPVNSTERR